MNVKFREQMSEILSGFILHLVTLLMHLLVAFAVILSIRLVGWMLEPDLQVFGVGLREVVDFSQTMVLLAFTITIVLTMISSLVRQIRGR